LLLVNCCFYFSNCLEVLLGLRRKQDPKSKMAGSESLFNRILSASAKISDPLKSIAAQTSEAATSKWRETTTDYQEMPREQFVRKHAAVLAGVGVISLLGLRYLYYRLRKPASPSSSAASKKYPPSSSSATYPTTKFEPAPTIGARTEAGSQPHPSPAQASPPPREATVTRPLFGGAMTIALPEPFTDVSAFRQVPNHQEVYLDPATDRSLVVEINQYNEEEEDSDAVKTFFVELCNDMQAEMDTSALTPRELDSSSCPHLPAEVHKSVLVGVPKVSKYNQEALNYVQVTMCSIRLKQYESDILVIMYVPTAINDKSVVAGTEIVPAEVNAAIFSSALESFKIVDYGLFGD